MFAKLKYFTGGSGAPEAAALRGRMWFLFFFFFLSFVFFFLSRFLPEFRSARWVHAAAAVSVPFFFPNPRETDLGFFFFFFKSICKKKNKVEGNML